MPELRMRLQESLGRKFRIVRELTGGGMARVFLAEDVELERDVVIKVVSPELADEAFLGRFRSEVLHTTRLQHPTIVSVFDVGTIEGDGVPLPYYIMPYVRGESLRSRLNHEERLSVNSTLRILRSVLDALVYAHSHGVVHRDIKPENIFLSGTSAVLADFGVAKAVAGPPLPAFLTAPGTSVGTPHYMAPEQMMGGVEVDPRADLYALGVVAFEMLTGDLPWGTANTSEMLAAKVRGAHSSLSAVRPDVPEALSVLVDQCLAWDPASRPTSAKEMLQAVERMPMTLTPGTPTPAQPHRRHPRRVRGSLVAGGVVVALLALALWARERQAPQARVRDIRLAVLNPRIATGTAADSTLGHQLYHQLIAALYPVTGLQLVNETEISRMAELGVAPEQVMQKLRSAGYDSALVLETMKAGEGGFQLQLVLQHLQQPRREVVGNPVRLRTLDRLSPDSARRLVGKLVRQVASRFGLEPAARGIRDTESSDAGLARSLGRDAMSSRTPRGIREAITHFERGVRIDTTYAQAYADLADARTLALFYRYRTDLEPYANAAAAVRFANRAIALQPSLADGYTARGYVGMVAGAPARLVRESYQRAQRLHPENPDSRLWYVGLLALDNRYAEALDTLAELTRFDPESPSKRISIALYALPAQRYPDVIANAAQARASTPGFPFASALQLWGLILQGGDRIGECVRIDAGPYLGAKAMCLERTRGRAVAQPVLDTLFQYAVRHPESDSLFDSSQYASELALHAAAHGEMDSAREWMRAAFQASPLGIEPRFLRSGLFNEELIRYGDSLRTEAWQRVEALAQADPSTSDGTPW